MLKHPFMQSYRGMLVLFCTMKLMKNSLRGISGKMGRVGQVGEWEVNYSIQWADPINVLFFTINNSFLYLMFYL
jgi:hypothetical protein